MQQRPIRRQTAEFVGRPGWNDAPQTMDAIPLPPSRPQARPHHHLRDGAMTFVDVADLSFRRDGDGDLRELWPYSAVGFIAGAILLALVATMF